MSFIFHAETPLSQMLFVVCDALFGICITALPLTLQPSVFLKKTLFVVCGALFGVRITALPLTLQPSVFILP